MSKLYHYRIGYDTFEESEYNVLLHEKKFSKKKFDKMILEAIDYIVGNKVKSDEYIETYQYIHMDIVKYLVDNYGFKELEYINEWDVFGWIGLPIVDDTWKDQYEEDTKKVIKLMEKKDYYEI